MERLKTINIKENDKFNRLKNTARNEIKNTAHNESYVQYFLID